MIIAAALNGASFNFTLDGRTIYHRWHTSQRQKQNFRKHGGATCEQCTIFRGRVHTTNLQKLGFPDMLCSFFLGTLEAVQKHHNVLCTSTQSLPRFTLLSEAVNGWKIVEVAIDDFEKNVGTL